MNVNYLMAMNAMESMYVDKAKVITYVSVRDEITGVTSKVEQILCGNIPCRLSYKSIKSVSQNGVAPEQTQEIKLFLGMEHRISPGCKVVITHGGQDVTYKASSKAAIYPTHQEVVLELFDRWA